jgi:hypothetical protein
MDCCNSAVSALKEQLFFSGMQYMKREKGQLFVEPLFNEFFQRRAAGGWHIDVGKIRISAAHVRIFFPVLICIADRGSHHPAFAPAGY